MRWLIWLSATVSLAGCVYSNPAVIDGKPDLCASIPVPEPFARDVTLKIARGELADCDAGCRTLIGNYAATREALKTACAK